MKRALLIVLMCVLLGGLAYGATLQKGETFTANDTVTNTRLHELVDDATISDIDQADIAANYGLVVKSSSQPTDTDALWNDTGTDACLKAYVGGAYEEVGSTPASITTGAISGTTATFTGEVQISNNVTITGDVSIVGSLSLSGVSSIFGTIQTLAKDTVYRADRDGIVTYVFLYDGETDCSAAIYAEAADTTPDEFAAVWAHKDDDVVSTGTRYATLTTPIKKGWYWSCSDVGTGTAAVTITWTPIG